MSNPFRPQPQECIIDTSITRHDVEADGQFLAFDSWDSYFNDPDNYSTPPTREMQGWIKEQAITRPYGRRRWCSRSGNETTLNGVRGAYYEDVAGNAYFVPRFNSLSWTWATPTENGY